jgi:DNA-binding Lrp family transcriptional regulator
VPKKAPPKRAPPRPPGPPPRSRPLLDEIDRRLVDLLIADGRMPNSALASAAGIAASTCLSRVRSLRERGIIKGFHAEVDPAALGRPIQALIAVRLAAHSRDQIEEFRAAAVQLPGVLGVFHVSGANDYLLHIAARSTGELRDFVLDHLTASPAVAHAETSIIFEHVRAVP